MLGSGPGTARRRRRAVEPGHWVLATFAVIAILLGAAALLSRLAHEAGLPAPAATVLVGVAAGGMLPHALHIALTPQILGIFLPALIFEAAWAYDAHALRRAALAIGVLALPGVVPTALVIAAGAAFSSRFTLPAALALARFVLRPIPSRCWHSFENSTFRCVC
ncbi:MAG: cation:proton antiporter [Candidatus Eremiobacteraeota bacterium]|nr:cation:proton antiporter [Candidatus Eremiobacteraeota bacterium]